MALHRRAHRSRDGSDALSRETIDAIDDIGRNLYWLLNAGCWMQRMKRLAFVLIAFLLLSTSLFAQDWIRTGTGLGVEKLRLAVADFKPSGGDPALLQTFNGVLWNDLDQAGIFELVSK